MTGLSQAKASAQYIAIHHHDHGLWKITQGAQHLIFSGKKILILGIAGLIAVIQIADVASSTERLGTVGIDQDGLHFWIMAPLIELRLNALDHWQG